MLLKPRQSFPVTLYRPKISYQWSHAVGHHRVLPIYIRHQIERPTCFELFGDDVSVAPIEIGRGWMLRDKGSEEAAFCQFEITQSSRYIRRLGNLNTYIPVPALLLHVYKQVGPPNIYIFLYLYQKCLKPHPGSRVRKQAETRDIFLTQYHPDWVWEPTQSPIK